ncbi:MAG TPA: MmgE/PrpD family protein [Streptosporangiaceae bacterium]|jgi:2-methylcitrate dehydratase PrpD
MPDPASGLAARIAGFVTSTPAGRGQLDQARLTVLDTIGVALAGGAEPAPVAVRSAQRPGWDTDPRIWWDGTPAGPAEAVLANAVAAHGLDYDCLIPAAYVQPGAVLVPALIALAERDGVTGARLLDGVARGVGLLGALGRDLGHQLHTRGWHPTCVLGVVAAAAAGAHLLGLPTGGIATAVNIAVSLSGGLKQNFGSMTKELQVGEAARGGAQAALLSAAGVTANPRAADSWLGLVGPPGHRAPTLEPPPGGPDVHIKRYPCCGRMHAALDAAAALRNSRPPAAGEVRSVACHLNPADIAHIDRAEVHTPAEAKFSVQYGLARMLARGQVGLSDFEPQELAAADVARLMPRVRIHPDGAVPSFGAQVVIGFSTGEQQRQHAAGPAAASAADVAGKFADCCARAGRAAADARTFAAMITRPGAIPDPRTLVRSLPGRASVAV